MKNRPVLAQFKKKNIKVLAKEIKQFYSITTVDSSGIRTRPARTGIILSFTTTERIGVVKIWQD